MLIFGANMARKQETTTPDKGSNLAIVILAIAGIAVAGLVGWAMYRSMQAPVSHTAVTETATETAAPPPPPDEHASVRRVTADELKAKIDRGEVTVIDVRDADSYMKGHIPNAKHIPLASVQGELPYLPKDKEIVFYCT